MIRIGPARTQSLGDLVWYTPFALPLIILYPFLDVYHSIHGRVRGGVVSLLTSPSYKWLNSVRPTVESIAIRIAEEENQEVGKAQYRFGVYYDHTLQPTEH